MTTGFLQKIFGSRNQRLVKQYQKTVAAINALEPTVEKYSDDQLRAKTDEFRQRVAGGESLDVILPEAFAVCREASKRVLKMRHFDVQLIGGMVLQTAQWNDRAKQWRWEVNLLGARKSTRFACRAARSPSTPASLTS